MLNQIRKYILDRVTLALKTKSEIEMAAVRVEVAAQLVSDGLITHDQAVEYVNH